MKHATDCKLIFALVILIASGCGKNPGSEPGVSAPAVASSGDGLANNGSGSNPAPPSQPSPPLLPEPTPPSVPAPTPPALNGGPAAWSGLANTAEWTRSVHSVVSANLASFEKAKDRESFCPGYSTASLAQRETCWIRLVSAVVKFESAFNPANAYKESSGVYSVGLLQLSPGECANASTLEKLKDPVQNLLCGTKKMADLIARYGYVTSPDNTHGAAAYWSTLRAPYVSGNLHLGKRNEVAKISAVYRTVYPAGPGWESIGGEQLAGD